MNPTESSAAREVLTGAFGFEPDESVAHFIVHIPVGSTLPVEISEHLSWDPTQEEPVVHFGPGHEDGQVRCRLARSKWNDIAEVVRAEINTRLKKTGRRPGKWRAGFNYIGRVFGKEMTLLAWAIEDADPALTPTAIANWQGLAPEERWWLYTMTAAATGNHTVGRNRGWRKAVRFALTENPLTHRAADQPVVPEFFRLVSEQTAVESPAAPDSQGYLLPKPTRAYTARTRRKASTK